MDTGGTGRTRKVISQINVTPLVDVMLVLLTIFMVTAPMMQEGIDVNLPKVEASAISARSEPLVVTIDRSRRVYIDGRYFTPPEFRAKLKAIHSVKSDQMVLLKADESVPYGYIVTTMADMHKAGIDKIGMMTEPPSGGR